MIKEQTIFKLWYLFSWNKKILSLLIQQSCNKPGKKMHLMADKDNHLINLFLEIQSSCSLILDKWLYGRFLFTQRQYLIWELEQRTFLKDATFTYERLRDFRKNCCAYKALSFSCQFITKSQNFSRAGRVTRVKIPHWRIQVNLCQKLLFLHQLTHNMTTDFHWITSSIHENS